MEITIVSLCVVIGIVGVAVLRLQVTVNHLRVKMDTQYNVFNQLLKHQSKELADLIKELERRRIVFKIPCTYAPSFYGTGNTISFDQLEAGLELLLTQLGYKLQWVQGNPSHYELVDTLDEAAKQELEEIQFLDEAMTDVNVVKGPLADDQYERIYYTGDGGKPKIRFIKDDVEYERTLIKKQRNALAKKRKPRKGKVKG